VGIVFGLVLLFCAPGTSFAATLGDTVDWYGTDGSRASWVLFERNSDPESSLLGLWSLESVSGNYQAALASVGYGTIGEYWNGYIQDDVYSILNIGRISPWSAWSEMASGPGYTGTVVNNGAGMSYVDIGGTMSSTPEPITCVSMGIVAGVLALSRRRKGLKKP